MTASPAPEKLFTDENTGLEFWRISPRTLLEQDKNARVQSPGVFKALVRNVKKGKRLESVPFCGRDAGEPPKFWIYSGHHRTRASIQAELESIIILVDPSPKTRSEVVAKQLAHNAINGQDDPAVMLQLLDEINDVDALLESAVDRDAIEKLASAPVNAQDVSVDYDFKLVTFAFLPKQVKDLEALCDQLSSSESVLTAPVDAHQALVTALKKLGKKDNIRSMGAIVYRMVEIVNEYVAAGEDEAEAQSAEALS